MSENKEVAAAEDKIEIYWGNLFSFRFWWYSAMGTLIVTFGILGLIAWATPLKWESIPEWPFWLIGVPTALFILAACLTMAAYCTFCGSRMTFGYETCPKCGKENP